MTEPGGPVATRGKGASASFFSVLDGIAAVIDWSGRLIAVACLGVMFLLLFVNVTMRYLLGSGIPWAYEIHVLLLPWLVAGGVVVAAARGRNIAITIVPDLLGREGARWLSLAVNVALVVVCISVLWTSQPILRASKFQSLATLGIKQIWGYSSLVYAFGGMAAIAALDAVRAVTGRARTFQTSLG